MKYYVGIDIGGTNIKTGVVTETGEIVSEHSIPTRAERSQNEVLKDIIASVRESVAGANVNPDDILAAGMGTPGFIDSKNGIVIYNNNLGWRDFRIAPEMSRVLGIPVTLENDADAAALGEVIAGSAKGTKSAMIITLGTGVGTGYVVDGKIVRGCEFGHMVIEFGGRRCTCGRKGCFETYCSATGLINMTKELIAQNPEGKTALIAAKEGSVGGQTVFEAADEGDREAAELIDRYISYLACGLVNLINGLQPETISLGGGVAKQGERLLKPLRQKVGLEIYEGITFPKIVNCTLGYKAGLIGAALSAR
ncbi:MAG: ROK family protein [Synergistaceae bacterium]|nr:ROK family protein [Synergistaceae bacterium]